MIKSTSHFLVLVSIKFSSYLKLEPHSILRVLLCTIHQLLYLTLVSTVSVSFACPTFSYCPLNNGIMHRSALELLISLGFFSSNNLFWTKDPKCASSQLRSESTFLSAC